MLLHDRVHFRPVRRTGNLLTRHEETATAGAGHHDAATDDLLSESSVGDYLIGRGLASTKPTRVTKLAGGVSNLVLAVEFGPQKYVVKQSLARLAVAEEWLSPTDRVITEAETMELLGRITPTNVPTVFDQDAARHAITLALAPPSWADWKTFLMAGAVRPSVARTLGNVIVRWHIETCMSVELGHRLDDYAAFESLRIEPFHRTVARRVPEAAEMLTVLIDEMTARRFCLVHGDFSPKNILISPEHPVGDGLDGEVALWVIDFEVAHRGDPVFDVAFMATHLLMKSLAMPSSSDALDDSLRSFLAAYSAGVVEAEEEQRRILQIDPAYLGRHIGALLLSRVHGKSPAGYLDTHSELRASRLGIDLLSRPPSTTDELFARRDEWRS